MGWQSHTPSPPYDRHLKEVTHLPLPPLPPTFGLPFSLSHSPSTITHFTLHYLLFLYSKESLLSSLPLAQRRSRHLSFTPSPSSTQPPLPLEAHGRSKKERKPKLCSTHTCVTLLFGKRCFDLPLLFLLNYFRTYTHSLPPFSCNLAKNLIKLEEPPPPPPLPTIAAVAVAINIITVDHPLPRHLHSLHLLHLSHHKVGTPQPWFKIHMHDI